MGYSFIGRKEGIKKRIEEGKKLTTKSLDSIDGEINKIYEEIINLLGAIEDLTAIAKDAYPLICLLEQQLS